MADWRSWGVPLIVIACILIVAGLLFMVRKYIRGPMYTGTARMDGKTVVITGANTGCGLETARDMARRGAKVVILCRNLTKAKDAANEIKRDTGVDIIYYELDLSSFDSVRKCAAIVKSNEPKIDVLINNAGIMTCPQWETKDGYEMQFGTNHLGHFLLTLLLLDNIKAAAPSRIVNLSSMAHFMGAMNFDDLNQKKNYSAAKAYNQSKLANILFTKSLAKRVKDDGVTTYALHPGIVETELSRHLDSTYGSVVNFIWKNFKFSKTPVLGAQTTIYCAVDNKAGTETGKYYNDCKEQRPSAKARNEEDAERLWKMSLDMVNLDNFKEVDLHSV